MWPVELPRSLRPAPTRTLRLQTFLFSRKPPWFRVQWRIAPSAPGRRLSRAFEPKNEIPGRHRLGNAGEGAGLTVAPCPSPADNAGSGVTTRGDASEGVGCIQRGLV